MGVALGLGTQIAGKEHLRLSIAVDDSPGVADISQARDDFRKLLARSDVRGLESHGEHCRVEIREGGCGLAANIGAQAGLQVHDNVDSALDCYSAADFIVFADALD